MKVKVCGMRESANISELARLKPDYMGFVFYKHSPRNAIDSLDDDTVSAIPSCIKKVGVFVNASLDTVRQYAGRYDLDYAQLHGSESPDYCSALVTGGIKVIKAFMIHEDFDFAAVNDFTAVCDFFLFDCRGKYPGGNSTVFNWKLLDKTGNQKPFFLSGGIGIENLEKAKNLKGMNLHALDVNSRFETSPGLKNIEKLNVFLQLLKTGKLDAA